MISSVNIGDNFGRLTIIKSLGSSKRIVKGKIRKEKLWRCKCECENYKNFKTSDLKRIQSCGCIVGREKLIVKPASKFKMLTVVKYLNTDAGGNKIWECLCECGERAEIRTFAFNKTISCGCIRPEKIKKNKIKVKTKKCSSCKKIYDSINFGKRPSAADGLKSNCKFCYANYRKENVERMTALRRIRKKAVKQATPWWVDTNELIKIDKKRIKLQLKSKKEYHIDHIIPLRHKRVCGLHVPWNLQILEASKNLTKGNRANQIFLDNFGLSKKK